MISEFSANLLELINWIRNRQRADLLLGLGGWRIIRVKHNRGKRSILELEVPRGAILNTGLQSPFLLGRNKTVPFSMDCCMWLMEPYTFFVKYSNEKIRFPLF